MACIYQTDSGIVVPAVTAAQMREIDRIAIQETGPNLFQMMENAGRNLAEFSIERLGDSWREESIVVVAGPGGNGGGGLCAARHLANRGGTVAVVLISPDRLREVTAWQNKVFRETSGTLAAITALPSLRPSLILDAILGYSLSDAPRGNAREAIEWANSTAAIVLSLDLPSGLHATEGTAPGVVMRAEATVTLALPKTGLHSPETGELFLADIGIPAGAYARAGIDVPVLFDHRSILPLQKTPL